MLVTICKIQITLSSYDEPITYGIRMSVVPKLLLFSNPSKVPLHITHRHFRAGVHEFEIRFLAADTR